MENPTLGRGPLNVRKSEVCRLCMRTHEYYLNIFVSNEEIKTSIGKAIEDLLVLKVAKDDNLPTIVCCPCITKLMEFREFKEMCVNSAREFGRLAPVEPMTCPVKDECLPMQMLGLGTSGMCCNSVDGESRVPKVPNELSLDPYTSENQSDTKEVYPWDPLEESDNSGEEDSAETECNEDAAVCDESKKLLMGDQCPLEGEGLPVRFMDGGEGVNVEKKSLYQNEACDPLAFDNLCSVKDEFLPMQLLGEATSGMWSNCVDGESRVSVAPNDLSLDPFALENQSDTKEVFPRDPLGQSDDCGEEDFAGTECNEDASVCSESKQLLVDDQVDRCNNFGELSEEPDKEFDKFGADRQGIPQNEVLNDHSCDPVREENLQLENSIVVDCFSEGSVKKQKINVKFYASSNKFSQLNDRVRPIRNHEREQLCHLAAYTNYPTVYICNYCSTRYSEKESLALHIKRHVDGEKSAGVLPKEFSPGFSQNQLVKDIVNVEPVILETSNMSLMQKSSRLKIEKLVVEESYGGENLGMETFHSTTLLSRSVEPFKLQEKAASVCDTCGIAFLKKSDLVKHVNVHTGLNRFHCRFCGGKLISKGMLNGHQAMHTGVEWLLCNLCGKECSTYGHQHKRVVTNTHFKLLKCDLCGNNFKNAYALKKHSMIHSGVNPYKCNECGKAFSRKGDLNAHSVVHTGVRRFKCNECGKMFARKSHLETHTFVHTGVKRFKCNECGKMFSRKSELKNHTFVHTGVKPFKCNECGKMFSQRSHLETHSVLHTGVEPFKCIECGKVFTQRSYLKAHSVLHTGVKPFKCNECGKMFARKSYLETHTVVHTGVKPFKCNDCGKMFATKSELKNHTVVHTGVKRFKCDECGKMFSRKFELKTHSVVHTGLKPFKCNECGKMFTQLGSVRRHSRIHSGVNLYKSDV